MDVSVELHCDKCGSANLSLPPEPSDAVIGCNDCGQDHGTLDELADTLMRCARARSSDVLRQEASRMSPS